MIITDDLLLTTPYHTALGSTGYWRPDVNWTWGKLAWYIDLSFRKLPGENTIIFRQYTRQKYSECDNRPDDQELRYVKNGIHYRHMETRVFSFYHCTSAYLGCSCQPVSVPFDLPSSAALTDLICPQLGGLDGRTREGPDKSSQIGNLCTYSKCKFGLELSLSTKAKCLMIKCYWAGAWCRIYRRVVQLTRLFFVHYYM